MGQTIGITAATWLAVRTGIGRLAASVLAASIGAITLLRVRTDPDNR